VGLQSVFAILDRLRRPSAHETEAPAGTVPSSTPGEEYNDDDRGDGNVMLYAPLVPGEDSEVELAASDITSVSDDGETLEYEQPARPLSFVQAGEQHTPRSPSRTLPPEIPGRSAQDEGPAGAFTRKEPGSVARHVERENGRGWETRFGQSCRGYKVIEGQCGRGSEICDNEDSVPSPDKIKISFQAT
jgi:hypothetical protein